MYATTVQSLVKLAQTPLSGKVMRMDSTNLPTQPEIGGFHKIMRLYLFSVHPIPSTSTGWMSLCYEVMNGESAENGQLPMS
jgi:hypothetical protein